MAHQYGTVEDVPASGVHARLMHASDVPTTPAAAEHERATTAGRKRPSWLAVGVMGSVMAVSMYYGATSTTGSGSGAGSDSSLRGLKTSTGNTNTNTDTDSGGARLGQFGCFAVAADDADVEVC